MGKKKFKCPECGGKGEPTGNTWPLTSPMALMGGSLIIMGTLECQECGNKFRKKLKELPLEGEEAKEEMEKAEEEEEE
ncbi:hypothetical protein AKJ52_02245 [candidate division MSBL1 archaeon SCGC-AAA382C18]|uniref:Uncharacterized protein n=1 Tax=candidate division MSBL1 archaeon SCGC-AAA382C18 TaxID=1698281 RepID=A0A133VIY3_9EURY|nr:hypothetical protein AKJ52_02245 [candidate division MSBL1 archaeon SCGC-AAA382C18]